MGPHEAEDLKHKIEDRYPEADVTVIRDPNGFRLIIDIDDKGSVRLTLGSPKSKILTMLLGDGSEDA